MFILTEFIAEINPAIFQATVSQETKYGRPLDLVISKDIKIYINGTCKKKWQIHAIHQTLLELLIKECPDFI